MHIDLAAGTPAVAIAHDTTNSKRLGACMVGVLTAYHWAPPLANQSIELPFKFTAPGGQSVIDRRLVEAHGQGDVTVSVLLDEYNTGNPGASMFEIAIKAGRTTGLRRTARGELWYFLTPAQVDKQAVAAGDMIFVPADGGREVQATGDGVRAVIVDVPGGREGAARAGALPTTMITDARALALAKLLPAAAAKTFGPATIYLDDSILKGTPLAASILQLPAGAKVPEHVHAHETEMLYVLAGAGTMTVAGTPVPVTATSIIQIPPNTPHAFAATDAVRAVQIYTPAGPEQRFKKKP
jgi:quercetin dioxygenase-like cupin family protein